MLYDKERLDAAYAKVGLFADSAWAVNDADGYYKANQEPCEKIGKPRSVLDTIPESRLAGYGTYLYDEQREKQYWSEFERPNYPVQYDNTPNNEEIWCNENVEKIFNILNNPYTKTSELEKRCQEVANGASSSSSGPSATSSGVPRKEQLAIEYNIDGSKAEEGDAEGVEDFCDENIRNSPPRGTAKNFSELVLQMQLHSEEIRALWERNSQYSLNVNVPEFYPKQPSDNYGQQEGLDLNSNQNLNPNTNTNTNLNLNLNSGQEPEAEQPVCEYEAVLIPSLLPWLNYSYPLRSFDFREINYLTNEFQKLVIPNTLPSTSQSQTNFQLQQQVNASAAATMENVQAVASPSALAVTTATAVVITSQQQQQQQQQQRPLSAQPQPQPQLMQPQSQPQPQPQSQPQASTSATIQQQEQQPTRRLYSAVLQNQASDTNVAKSPSVDEFEELEREALEQYRPSTENLRRASTDSIISAKYQELERLALEQYNSASSTDTSAGGQGNECNPLHEPPCGGKMSPYAALLLANSVLVGFYRSVVNTRLLTNLYSNVSRNR